MKATLHNTTDTTKNASLHKPFFQPKLTINQPNDVYEQEADAVAETVMRMPEKKGQKQTFFKPVISTIQRKCKECEEKGKLQRKQMLEDDSPLQRKTLNNAFIQTKCAACEKEEKGMQRKESEATSVPQATSTVYQALQTGGHSLDSGTQSFMESRFGYDFKHVQIHNDSLAHQSSAEINALAYTQGKHVVFGANQYQPNTDVGKKLLAHELTHVVQQGASSSLNNKVNRKPNDEEEPHLTRYQEIEQSIDSPGEFEVLEQPFGISVYNFAINRYALKAEHKTALKKIGKMLASAKANSLSAFIMGNTDSTGGPIINNPLSVNRAKSVRNYLADITGKRYGIEGEGQDMPVAANEIISGRSRNRRVDIVINYSVPSKPNPTGLILPPPYVYKAPIKIERDELINKEKKKTEDCPWPWSCINIPWIWPWFPIPHCVKLLIECEEGADPEACYDFYEDCIKRDDKKKRACPENVDLPDGNLQVDMMWPYMALRNPFWMMIDFKDDKDNGCYCECGEYLQNVRGFFETEYKDGRKERAKKKLTPGIMLEENTFHEDGDGTANSEYGHRSHPGRLNPNPNYFFIDKFFLTQADGCSYVGMDQPGFGNGIAQSDEVRRTWFLEFEGMPVDTCVEDGKRTRMEQYKKTWRIQGEIVRPPEPKPKTPIPPTTPSVPKAPGNGGSGSGGNIKVVQVTPTKAKTHPSQSQPSSIEGISPDAKVGQGFDMTILFNVPGKSDTYSYMVHVTVIDPTNDDFITIETSNEDDLNLAPQGESEIVLKAHKKIKIERSYLQ